MHPHTHYSMGELLHNTDEFHQLEISGLNAPLSTIAVTGPPTLEQLALVGCVAVP